MRYCKSKKQWNIGSQLLLPSSAFCRLPPIAPKLGPSYTPKAALGSHVPAGARCPPDYYYDYYYYSGWPLVSGHALV